MESYPSCFRTFDATSGAGASGVSNDDSQSQVDATGAKYDPENFSKPKLNVRELFGSRWAINQKDKITVFHSLDISDASLIHDNQLTLRVEFNLRQTWNSPGLEFPVGLFKDSDPDNTSVTADDNVLAYMWSPDSYISSARESNMATVGTPLNQVLILKNRTIIYKVRMYTKVSCTANFQWYPLDVQNCELTIESYKFSDAIAIYTWTDANIYRPLVLKVRRLLQYEFMDVNRTTGCFQRGGSGARYPFVTVMFVFGRKLGNNLIQVYTPTILVVVLSWFSFWLGLDAIPGRITLLITCMLTLVTMHSGIKRTIPPVHYITMMDVWMVCCLAMVFGAMSEFVGVKYLHWRMEQAEANRKHQDIKQVKPFIQALNNSHQAILKDPALTWTKMQYGQKASPLPVGKAGLPEYRFGNMENYMTSSNTTPVWISVDKLCRALFPLFFLAFNLFYWPVLFKKGGKVQDDEFHYDTTCG